MRQIEGLIGEGILQGVRTMLPVKSILREYLAGDETDEEEEEEEEEEAPEPVPSEPVVQEPMVAEPVVSEPVVEPPAPEPVVEPPAPSPAVEPTVPTIILDDKPRIDFSSPADDLFKEAAKGLVDAEPELAEAEPELEEAEIPEDTGAMEATAPADEEILDGIEFEELS